MKIVSSRFAVRQLNDFSKNIHFAIQSALAVCIAYWLFFATLVQAGEPCGRFVRAALGIGVSGGKVERLWAFFGQSCTPVFQDNENAVPVSLYCPQS